MLHVREREDITKVVAGESFQFTHRLENDGNMAEGKLHRNWYKATKVEPVQGGFHIYCELDPKYFPNLAPRIPLENEDECW